MAVRFPVASDDDPRGVHNFAKGFRRLGNAHFEGLHRTGLKAQVIPRQGLQGELAHLFLTLVHRAQGTLMGRRAHA